MAVKSETLLEETLRLLRNEKRNLTQIATASGLNYHWLRKLSYGIIKSPGINYVEKLHTFLSQP